MLSFVKATQLRAAFAPANTIRLLSSTMPKQQTPPPPPTLPHFKLTPGEHPLDKDPNDPRPAMFKKAADSPAARSSYLLHQPVYTEEEMASITPTHVPPKRIRDRLALFSINVLRKTFDYATGYGRKKFVEEDWLTRIIFLETVAGVPGMVGGMHRHMKSLRSMRRDRGWVHTLLEECENERMHLLTFLQLKQPGALFRTMVLLGQGVFFNFYFVFYWVSPSYCHRFVGYLEEEAVKTYTHLLQEIKDDQLPKWKNMEAPPIAKNYWNLSDKALLYDVFMAVRADEANHRDVNHELSTLAPDQANPFSPPPDETPRPSKA